MIPRPNDGCANPSLAQRAPCCTSASLDMSHAASLDMFHAKCWAADASASNRTKPPTHLVVWAPSLISEWVCVRWAGGVYAFLPLVTVLRFHECRNLPADLWYIDIPRSIRIGGQSTALLRAALAWAARGSMADGQETMRTGGEGTTTPTSTVMYGDFRAAKEGAEEVNRVFSMGWSRDSTWQWCGGRRDVVLEQRGRGASSCSESIGW